MRAPLLKRVKLVTKEPRSALKGERVIEPTAQEVNRYRNAFEQSSSDEEDLEYDFKKRYPEIFALYGYDF